MIGLHDREVASRFDASEARFKASVDLEDYRVRAVLSCLGPLTDQLILDLGCGKGRFATHLTARGAKVVGLDLSAAMLSKAEGLDRVRASARRLPFADSTFDAVIAVEVLEHVGAVDAVLLETRRVLKPSGTVAIVDKNAWSLNTRRPWLPSVVVKWIDERRGLWMYPGGGPVRERWFTPWRLREQLRHHFKEARVEYLLRPEEQRCHVFRAIPPTRLMTLWSAKVPVHATGLQLSPGQSAGAIPPLGQPGWESEPGCWIGRTSKGSVGSESSPGRARERARAGIEEGAAWSMD